MKMKDVASTLNNGIQFSMNFAKERSWYNPHLPHRCSWGRGQGLSLLVVLTTGLLLIVVCFFFFLSSPLPIILCFHLYISLAHYCHGWKTKRPMVSKISVFMSLKTTICDTHVNTFFFHHYHSICAMSLNNQEVTRSNWWPFELCVGRKGQ